MLNPRSLARSCSRLHNGVGRVHWNVVSSVEVFSLMIFMVFRNWSSRQIPRRKRSEGHSRHRSEDVHSELAWRLASLFAYAKRGGGKVARHAAPGRIALRFAARRVWRFTPDYMQS